jgi:hypothetical protein
MNPIEKVFLPIANFTKNKPVDFLLFLFALKQKTLDFQLIDTVAKLISNKVFAHYNNARMLLLFCQ